MTAQRADPLEDELALEWGKDTIYCEATCDPEDVLYEGSDDEDYDSPASRKLRYEAAGQRFLDGKTPFILTALLKGPFDAKSSNWVNPWRSKYRTSGTAKKLRTSPGKLKRSANVKRNVSIPETVQPPSDSLECHLPSPESLSQNSETAAHPYLEEDELAKVQEWRNAVESEKGQKDKFWASTPQGTTSERKRRATGSSWLKHLASKRRRTDIMETGSINTPVPSRSQPHTPAADALNTSFSSVPDRLPSSAVAAERYFSAPRNEYPASEDELSHDSSALDQAEASTDSSSSLSQLQYTPILDSNVDQSSQGSLEQQTPSKTPASRQCSSSTKTGTGPQNVAGNNATPRPDFETQEDESFCFKMRPKPNEVAESASGEDLVSTIKDDGATWSGLSSPNRDMASTIFDLNENSPVEEQPDLQESETATEIDQGLMTSPLSSISSKKFDGFDISTESPQKADVASDSSSVTDSVSDASEVANSSSQGSVKDGIEIMAAESHSEAQGETDSDDEDMEETIDVTSSLPVAENIEGGDDDTADGSDEENGKDEDGKVKATEILSPSMTSNNTTPQNLAASQKAKTTPSKSTPSKVGNHNSTPSRADFLMASVKKRFIPQSSWERITHMAENSSQYNLPKRTESQASKPASSPTSTREKAHQVGSTHSTPKIMAPHQISGSTQPPSHDPFPTVVNIPAKEKQPEQQQPQPVSARDVTIPFSQQSPWAANKLSQYASLSLSQISSDKELDTIVATPSPEKQTPWTDEKIEMPIKLTGLTPAIRVEDQTELHETNASTVASQADTPMQDTSAAATPTLVSSPEPQFSVKSFASFRSPSPERRSSHARRAVWRGSGSRLPCTQGILASATKNPWQTKSSERRVSFAPLPHETEGRSSMPTTPCPPLSKERPGSPPPDTPMSQLPTSEDSKFHKHFGAVVRGPVIRQTQRLLPSESQQTVGSPLPDAMAEAFITADHLRQSTPPAGPTKSDLETDESQDPMEMAEDVFREMDHVFNWDLSGTGSSQKSQGLQSPW